MGAVIKTLVTILTTVLFAFCLVFVGLRAAGFATFVVSGGSMEPAIHKGSLVIDQPVTSDKLRLGDVITFDHADQTITHRVVGVEATANGTLFSTKGDANTVGDPEPMLFPGRVGVVKLAVPGVGYVVAWMQYIWQLGATIVAAIIFFACAGLFLLRRDGSAPVAAPAATGLAFAPKRAVAAAKPARAAKTARVRSIHRGRPGDPNAIWAEHERWLIAARVGKVRVA